MNPLLAFLILFSIYGQEDEIKLREGKYLTRLAGCAECHSHGIGDPLSGQVALLTPFGTFYTQNITPDPETGLGLWSFEDFKTALRWGLSPEDKIYYPAFPYRTYTKMSDADMQLIYNYLMEQAPVQQENAPHDLSFPFGYRWVNFFWQLLFFSDRHLEPLDAVKRGVGPFENVPNRSDQWNRGAYLVEAILHCAECHTPRNSMGALRSSRWMAGSDNKIEGQWAPNITPGEGALKEWTQNDWKNFLTSGFTPAGNSVGGEMALIIKNTSALRRNDREAVIEYLMSLEPIAEGD